MFVLTQITTQIALGTSAAATWRLVAQEQPTQTHAITRDYPQTPQKKKLQINGLSAETLTA